ncbi:hypothetical protein GOQ27_14400 [Clostridium sp. D2Q-11]|uniref:Uncharacterized protein n=1 Tax=Anaeromonas frigoriresistens TaxID=2683708 RepID=A0A942Z8C9_9FIRM|nr:hypothetical protein [Anaeromonas frigoriresistens]MBS4539662.1 hypothetical protein [Anaeromonas frigoriresistens]
MSKNQVTLMVSKYIILCIKTIFISILFIIIPIFFLRVTRENILRLFFEIASLMITVILPLVVIDGTLFESSKEDDINYTLLKSLNGNKKEKQLAHVDIISGIIFINSAMVIGYINEWIFQTVIEPSNHQLAIQIIINTSWVILFVSLLIKLHCVLVRRKKAKENKQQNIERECKTFFVTVREVE